MLVKIDHDAYLKFLSEVIDVVPGQYTRAQLLALATAQLDVPATRLASMFPSLKLSGTADVVKAMKVTEDVRVIDDAEDEVVVGGETAPWDEEEARAPEPAAETVAVDDAQMLEELKGVTWSDVAAPKGKPGLRHVFEVLAWLRADNKRILAVHAALLGDDFVKKPKPAKNLAALGEAVGHMPVWDSARWLFTVWSDCVSFAAFQRAWDDCVIDALVTELWDFGLDMNGPRDNTEAWRRAHQHSFMPEIISGEREDGVFKKRGSCASVMKAMKVVFDALPEDRRPQMHDHIVKNYDADKAKAVAPMVKIMNSKGVDAEVANLVCKLMAAGDVPVAVLAMVFQGEWDRLYTSLCSCLDTIGPKPPWLSASSG